MISGITGNPLVYLNGEFTPILEAKISVLDRGFIFGDGVYEVVPVYAGKPFRMQQHLQRLTRSLQKIDLPNPHSIEEWQELVAKVIATSDESDQFIYLQVTRGVAKRDHAFPEKTIPTVFAMTNKLVRPDTNLRVNGVNAVTFDDERWLNCDIKSISLLGNVLAKQFAIENNAMEVVMFRDNYLTEGSASNIWVVKDGILMAPPKNNLILEGIRYGLLEELAQSISLELVSRKITRQEVETADELLLTSATKEVLPITRLNNKRVGTGQRGAVCAALQAAYDQAIEQC